VGSGVVSVGFGVDVVGGRPGLAEAPTGAAIPPITSAASAATATARRLDNVAPQCIGPDEPGPYTLECPPVAHDNPRASPPVTLALDRMVRKPVA